MSQNPLPAAARARIDAHLAAVSAALAAADVPEAQRSTVIADLSTQIDDMLASTPAGGDVEAVLARLDSPSDFAAAWAPAATGDATAAPAERGLETVARISICCALVGVPAAIGVGMIASAGGAAGGGLGFVVFLGCEITAIVAGVIARRHHLARTGAWIGAALIIATVACATIWPHPPPPAQALPPTSP